MKRYECEREAELLEALRSGAWEPELRQHAEECAQCSELVMVSGFLQEEAAAPEAEPDLPDAGAVWWKARLAAKRAAAARAMGPIRLFGRLAWLAAVFAALWFISGPGPGLASQVGRQPLWSGPAGVAALAGGALALLSVFLGSAYLVWAEK